MCSLKSALKPRLKEQGCLAIAKLKYLLYFYPSFLPIRGSKTQILFVCMFCSVLWNQFWNSCSTNNRACTKQSLLNFGSSETWIILVVIACTCRFPKYHIIKPCTSFCVSLANVFVLHGMCLYFDNACTVLRS